MIVTYFTVGIAVILAGVYMGAMAMKRSPRMCALFKFIAGIGFLAVAVCAQVERAQPVSLHFVLILIGLLMGMCGDFLLALKEVYPQREDAFILLGIISFAIGHIFYIFYFTTLYDFGIAEVLIALVGAALMMTAVVKLFRFDLRKLGVPVALYAVVILLMAASAVACFIALPVSTGTIILLVAAILFVISDLVLSFIYFSGKVNRVMGIVNLTSYFAAQILFALSVAFL